MRECKVQVFGADVGASESRAVLDTALSGWLGAGPRVAEFERRFSARINRPFVMTNSCTNSLQIALRLLDLPPGSKVAVPSFTWGGCAGAILLEGLVPAFADADPDTGNVTRRTVADAIDDDVRAVMVVHYGGRPVRIDAMGLDLPVIEDAAHAVDSTVGDRYCGTLGDIGAYSFGPVKNLATPDGGGITFADPKFEDRARVLRHSGIDSTGYEKFHRSERWWEQGIAEAFPKCEPNDVAATIGMVQLERLPSLQSRREQIWETYQAAFRDITWVRTPPDPDPGTRHSYFTYLIRVPGGRDLLASHLRELGIYTTLRFHPLHLCEAYREFAVRDLPGCDLLNAEGLDLPLHPAMTDADISKVIEAVGGFRL